MGGGAGRLISWDDPGVVVGGSAVVGDPGTPQQLHRDLTSALLGQMADWLGAQPRQNIHSSRPQAGQSMFTLFSPSIALHNQHGRPNVEERESVCIDFYHELARGVKLGGGIGSVSLIWLRLLASRPDPSIETDWSPWPSLAWAAVSTQ